MSHSLKPCLLLLLPLALVACSRDRVPTANAVSPPSITPSLQERRYGAAESAASVPTAADTPAAAPEAKVGDSQDPGREDYATLVPAAAAQQPPARPAARQDKAFYSPPPAAIAPAPRHEMPMQRDITPQHAYAGEGYQNYGENLSQQTAQNPVSTFSLDVDTGSYSNVRRFLNQGQLPPQEAVRVEELLNYFSYDYPAAAHGCPFAIRSELGAAPWNPQHLLLRVGVKAVGEQAAPTLPPANLVFLVDVSGSMAEPDKLPLVRNALKLLTTRLRPVDHVSLVVYAGETQVLLPPTSGADKATILAAIDRLEAGGGTNGGAGIQMAYE